VVCLEQKIGREQRGDGGCLCEPLDILERDASQVDEWRKKRLGSMTVWEFGDIGERR